MRTLFEPPTLGGVGAIVTSCAYVCREEHPNPRMLGVYDDSFLPERSGPPGALIMYAGGFYPYPTPEEHWAYWSRYILINRYMDAPKPVYQDLLALVKDKDYFVLTTNVDHCFQKAGFDKKRLFYTQGDYGLFQCAQPCCRETWDNEEAIRRMVREQRAGKIPSEQIPCCPNCGRSLTMNLRSDDRFVQDEGWYRAAQRYEDFLRRHRRGKVLYLELGVGYNTPVIIKYPFWQLTAKNPDAVYACINLGQAECPGEIGRRAVCIDGDVGAALAELLALNRGAARSRLHTHGGSWAEKRESRG